jgi:DNA-binding response OmpR family regulator
MKILLVEASRFLRLATERALSHSGYEVTSAADRRRRPGAGRANNCLI